MLCISSLVHWTTALLSFLTGLWALLPWNKGKTHTHTKHSTLKHCKPNKCWTINAVSTGQVNATVANTMELLHGFLQSNSFCSWRDALWWGPEDQDYSNSLQETSCWPVLQDQRLLLCNNPSAGSTEFMFSVLESSTMARANYASQDKEAGREVCKERSINTCLCCH